jgi:hypothetical protein
VLGFLPDYIGNLRVNIAPPDELFAAVSVPPCSVITRCVKASPTPLPFGLVVKKGMKIF